MANDLHHDDFAFEPQRGLPEKLPAREIMLWQGRPSTWALMREAFGFRWIVGYFALVVIWRAAAGWLDGGVAATFAMSIPYMILGALALLVTGAMAAIAARSTVYTVTSSRVVMRIGAALTVTLNLPYAQIANAALSLRRDGTGTIAFDTLGDTQFSTFVLWPHMRPWHIRKTQPALRAIPDAARVAEIIADAAAARIEALALTGALPATAQAPRKGAVSAPPPTAGSIPAAIPAE